MPAEVLVRAMGADVRLAVPESHRSVLGEMADLLSELEQCWSRFLEGSEISRLNRARGVPSIVSSPTALLVDRAWSAHRLSDGLFDPLLLEEVSDAGYDRSFEQMGRGAAVSGVDGCGTAVGRRRSEDFTEFPAESLVDVLVDADRGIVQLPGVAAFDPGGIGKGLAADLLIERALALHADWVLADVGGDLRVAGRCPGADEWAVHVIGAGGGLICEIGLDEGAVATSSTSKRRWVGGHHIIDPRTRRPVVSDLERVTVISSQAWFAESMATAAVVAGHERAARMFDELDTPAFLIGHDRECSAVAGAEDYLR
jgi:FAD:protein FMN transferase